MKHIGSFPLGKRAAIVFHQEDQWVYPSITMEGHAGEHATIGLQYVTSREIGDLADKLNKLALELKKQGF